VPGAAPIASSTGSTRTVAWCTFSILTTARRSTTALKGDGRYSGLHDLDRAELLHTPSRKRVRARFLPDGMRQASRPARRPRQVQALVQVVPGEGPVVGDLLVKEPMEFSAASCAHNIRPVRPVQRSDPNERFTWSANRRHAPKVNRNIGPVRSFVSRTSTRPLWSAISTHSPPPFELYDALRHFKFVLSVAPSPPSVSVCGTQYGVALHRASAQTPRISAYLRGLPLRLKFLTPKVLTITHGGSSWR
jgi:hypothetical protein